MLAKLQTKSIFISLSFFSHTETSTTINLVHIYLPRATAVNSKLVLYFYDTFLLALSHLHIPVCLASYGKRIFLPFALVSIVNISKNLA